MATETVRGPRRSDARANHACVLAAAADVVAAADLDVPYDEIALAAGVGRATVYRHFPSREALLRALIDASLSRWEESFAEIEPGPDQLQRVFEAWVRAQHDRSHGIDLLTRFAPEDDLARARRRFEATLAEPTRAAREAGRIPAGMTPRDVRLILCMLAASLRSTTPPSDRRRSVELARGLLFAG